MTDNPDALPAENVDRRVGNRFWQLRSSHGRNPIFDNSDQIWEAACEYFEWVEDNPLWEDKVTSFQGINTHEPVARMRAMTIEGLCIFLDIGTSTWSDYKKKKDFSDIVARVEQIIRTQKFAGAAADLLNPNIIARDLGLVDKSDSKTTIAADDSVMAVMGRIAGGSRKLPNGD